MTPKSRIVSLLLLLATLAYAPILVSQESSPAPSRERGARHSGQENPRAAIKTFFEAMRGFKAGNESRLLEAVDCLFLGENLTAEERLNQGSQPAHTLFAAMNGLQFDMEAIDDDPTERNFQISLGAGENSIDLQLRRYDDGRWRISSQSLAPEFLATLEAQVAARADTDAEGESRFVDGLQSPRDTMEAFMKGMEDEDGFTLKNAIDTLDLSGMNEVDRESVGASQAADLKALIDRIKRVEFSEIPPESGGETYVFYQDPTGLGSIVLAPVPEEGDPGRKAWRFTKGTLEHLEALYLAYKDRPLVGGRGPKTESQPLANQIRDWTHANYPGMLSAPVYLKNYQWTGLLFLLMVGIVISRILTLLVGVFLRFWFRRKGFAYDDRLERDFIRPIRISLMAWVWLYGLTLLGLAPRVLGILSIGAFFVTLLGAVWAAYCLVDIIGKYLTERAKRSWSKHDDLLVPIVVRTLKIFIIVIGLVALAFQFNENPASLLTGLGLGGLAFALAAKDVVANVFGSITILTDRPFRIGDWVTIGAIDGSVESVGIRSTRIRTFYDSIITVPNSEITTTHIDNYGERKYRRIRTVLGLTYDTPPESMEAFCEGIRELIRTHPYTRKDSFHVYFNGFSASSLDVLVYCFLDTPDWGTELREKHRLFLDIIRLARALDVSFAYPTQTLFVNNETPEEPEPGGARAGAHIGMDVARRIVAEGVGLDTVLPPPVTFRGPDDTSSRTTKE